MACYRLDCPWLMWVLGIPCVVAEAVHDAQWQLHTQHNVHVAMTVCSAVGLIVFLAYALMQANQLGGVPPTYDVYDSDNYPQASCSC